MNDNKNALTLFSGAGLPAADIGRYKKALVEVQQTAPQIGGTPFLRLDPNDGIWVYGQQDTEVEEGSEWAVNPLTLEKGFVAWPKAGGKPVGKVLKTVFGPLPLLSDLPNVGERWDEAVRFELQCVSGEDVGTTVEFTSNALGGVEAFHNLLTEFQKQLDVDTVNLVPIVVLENSSYEHTNRAYGTVFKPVFTVARWVAMSGQPAAQQGNGAAPQTQVQNPPPSPAQPDPPQQPQRQSRSRRGPAPQQAQNGVQQAPQGQQPPPPAQPQEPQPTGAPGVTRQRRQRRAAQ